MRSLQTGIVAAATLLFAHPASAVVASGHWQIGPNTGGNMEANVYLSLDQTIEGDYTGTFLNFDAAAGTLRYVTMNVDEGSELFVAQPGAAFSDATATTAPFTSLFSSGATPLKVGQDFYVAGRTHSHTDPGFSWSDLSTFTSFGWAHLQVQNGSLVILDSAMAFREGGIVVGTTQAIPEPSVWMLSAMGLLVMPSALRRARRQG